MNVKLLRKVKRHILAEPKRLYMTSYIRTVEQGANIGREFAKCGTAACIAGWACLLEFKPENAAEYLRDHNIGEEAATILGLNNHEAFRLFEPGEWPDQFDGGTTDDGKASTARIAAARIEHFIKTKGRE